MINISSNHWVIAGAPHFTDLPLMTEWDRGENELWETFSTRPC